MIQLNIKCLTIALIAFSSSVDAKLDFYFFYPDSPTSNISQLKNEIDHLFQNENIAINFQPFIRESDFKQQAENDQSAVLMSPAWVFPGSKKNQLLLKAFAKGGSKYGKVLITKATSPLTSDRLQGATIAMTSMGDNIRQLSTTLNYKIEPNDIHIIEVNKDIDAIFAVALKQVDAAFVTLSSLKRIKKLNPRIIKSIKVITETKLISLPDIYSLYSSANKEEITKLLHFMKRLKNIKQNPFRKLLEIDEWRKIK